MVNEECMSDDVSNNTLTDTSSNDLIINGRSHTNRFAYSFKWVPSTLSDTIDCVCSVKTCGTWKEFIGVCVEVNIKEKSIKFATNGDYFVHVSDTSRFATNGDFIGILISRHVVYNEIYF